jgi:hypothetical protein
VGLADYDELVASVADWAARSDLTSVIPDFILLAEEDINNARLRCMQKTKTGTLTEGTRTLNIPQDRLTTVLFTLNENPLRVSDYATMEALYRQGDIDANDRPTDIAEFGDEFHFSPLPSGAHTYSHFYVQKAELAHQGENEVLRKYPSLYLFGTLCKMETYIKNDPRYPVWRAMLADSWRGAHASDEGARFGGAMPAPRVV